MPNLNGEYEFDPIATISGYSESYVDYQVELGKTYSYKVRAWKLGFPSEFSNIVEATTTLNPPSNLNTTTFYPYNLVKLSWNDNSNNEMGFEIWRKGVDNIWRIIDTVPADSTSYIDYSVSQFSDYFYKVRDVMDGASAFSNTSWVTTSPCIVENVDTFSISPSTSNAIVYHNNAYHFVYSKNNKVYYTYSGDGLTWSSHTEIDNGINPAIEVMGNTLWVFYFYDYKLKYAKKVGNTWQIFSTNIFGNTISLTNFMDTIFAFSEVRETVHLQMSKITFLKIKYNGDIKEITTQQYAMFGSMGKDTIEEGGRVGSYGVFQIRVNYPGTYCWEYYYFDNKYYLDSLKITGIPHLMKKGNIAGIVYFYDNKIYFKKRVFIIPPTPAPIEENISLLDIPQTIPKEFLYLIIPYIFYIQKIIIFLMQF